MDTITNSEVNALLWDGIKILVTFSATLIGTWLVLMKFVYTKFGEFTAELATTNTTLRSISDDIKGYKQDYTERHEKIERDIEHIEGKVEDLKDRVGKLEK